MYSTCLKFKMKEWLTDSLTYWQCDWLCWFCTDLLYIISGDRLVSHPQKEQTLS